MNITNVCPNCRKHVDISGPGRCVHCNNKLPSVIQPQVKNKTESDSHWYVWLFIIVGFLIAFSITLNNSENKTGSVIDEPTIDSSATQIVIPLVESQKINVTTPTITQPVQPQVLSPEIEKQLGDIIKFVMMTPGEPTQTTKAKFWSIAKKNGVTTKNISDTRDLIAGFAVDYQKLFYQDALASVRKGQVVKSVEREKAENNLLKIGVMTQERYAQNQKMIENIAYGLPITTAQGDAIFTEEIITAAIENINGVNKRIELLLNH